MTPTRGARARFEARLPAQGQYVFEQHAEPFGVLQAARLGFVCKFLEPLTTAHESFASEICAIAPAEG